MAKRQLTQKVEEELSDAALIARERNANFLMGLGLKHDGVAVDGQGNIHKRRKYTSSISEPNKFASYSTYSRPYGKKH